MAARIVIVSGFQVVDNPRVVKEANALAEAGFEVTVIGAVLDARYRDEIDEVVAGSAWRHLPVIDLASGSAGERVEFLAARARLKLWRAVRRVSGVESPAQLGYFAAKLYRMAQRERADLYIVHLEPALWAGARLARDGYRVAADIEDWYSEDGLAADRRSRPVGLLQRLEHRLMHHAAYTTTTSACMASALAKCYAAREPGVVYNSFPLEERNAIDGKRQERADPGIPSLVWFSQTVGPGRGLEQLVAALDALERPVELHIRGRPRPGYCEHLLRGVSPQLRARVFVHGRVKAAELLSRLSEHDIGYCGESSDTPSRDLTVTNKTLEYLRAGLAVLASDTRGQLEVAAGAPGCVSIFSHSDPRTLGEALLRWHDDRAALASAKAAAVPALERHFNWADSKARIVALAESALRRAPNSPAPRGWLGQVRPPV